MRTFILALVLALLAACADEVKKPSEDALMAEEAFGVAEGMRRAYVEKNFRGMKKYSTEDAYAEIARDIKKFKNVELEFKPRWVEIKADGALHLYVSWNGSWTLGGGREEQRRGMALFELRGRPLKLAGIIRSSPFREPEQAAVSD